MALCHSGLVSKLRFLQSPGSLADAWRVAVLETLQACAAAATAPAGGLATAKALRARLATVAVSEGHTAAAPIHDTPQQQQQHHHHHHQQQHQQHQQQQRREEEEEENEDDVKEGDHQLQQEACAKQEAADGIRVQPPPLCLDGFKTDVLASAAALQLMSSFGLRRLNLRRVDPSTIDGVFCAAVAQLSTAIELSLLDIDKMLDSEAVGRLVPLAQALGQLPSLAVLNCQMPAPAGQYLPRHCNALHMQCVSHVLNSAVVG